MMNWVIFLHIVKSGAEPSEKRIFDGGHIRCLTNQIDILPDELCSRMVMYKFVCDLCRALWGFHQSTLGINIPISRDGEDVIARSMFKIRRCNAFIGDDFCQQQLKFLVPG